MDHEPWEYFEKNKRQAVNIALPEREESEPNITEKQIEELKAITDGSLTHETLKNFGRWQAACAIKKLKEAKESLSSKLAFEYMAQKKKSENKANIFIIIGFIVIILLVFGFSNGLLTLLVLFIISLPAMLLIIAFGVADEIKKWIDK